MFQIHFSFNAQSVLLDQKRVNWSWGTMSSHSVLGKRELYQSPCFPNVQGKKNVLCKENNVCICNTRLLSLQQWIPCWFKKGDWSLTGNFTWCSPLPLPSSGWLLLGDCWTDSWFSWGVLPVWFWLAVTLGACMNILRLLWLLSPARLQGLGPAPCCLPGCCALIVSVAQ